jgi:hypothetical protein
MGDSVDQRLFAYTKTLGEDDSPQELQDGQDDIVHITEPAGFGLLRMMQSSTPVDCDIRRPDSQLPRRSQARTSVLLAKRKQPGERRAIVVSYSMGVDVCRVVWTHVQGTVVQHV